MDNSLTLSRGVVVVREPRQDHGKALRIASESSVADEIVSFRRRRYNKLGFLSSFSSSGKRIG